jgi:hypothetical protein
MANGEPGEGGWKKILEKHAVWVAIVLIVTGAVGMWHLYVALKEEVERIAKETSKFPASAIVAFSLGPGKCPDKWREVTELQGRFIIGAGQGTGLENRTYGQPGGLETVILRPENLPPHRHQVYRHAGEIIGETSGIQGAGSSDKNALARVRESLSGEGVGLSGERLASSPAKIIPPYFAFTFCRPDEAK